MRIDRMVRDVIEATLACDYEAISMSQEVEQSLEELRTVHVREHVPDPRRSAASSRRRRRSSPRCSSTWRIRRSIST
jgi:hypothetical protein